MRIIDTSTLTESSIAAFGETQRLWIYNGLDCCLTHEIDTELDSVMDEVSTRTYRMSLALQGPVLEMNMRGVLIDQAVKAEALRALQADHDLILNRFDRLCLAVFSQVVNPGSWQQTNKLFYEWLNLPAEKKRNSNGDWAPTTDRDALEQLEAKYFIAKPFVSHILKARDIAKQIATINTALGPDGRIRTSYSIAGTKTGRLASSLADFSDGGNLQNIDKRIRKMFVADPGYKFANIDLEQADARNIGAITWNLFPELMEKPHGQPNYLDAAESGDLHTTVCKLCWRELPWPGDPRGDRELADQPFYREKTYRDLGKVLGHGSNFNGKPPQMSKHTKTDQSVISDFQSRYFAAFPELRKRIDWVDNEIIEKGEITTLFGRRRHFLKRRGDNKTLNEGCAFEPQSMTAEEINFALLKVFALKREFPALQLLLQVHDSLLVQYPEELEDQIIPRIREAFRTPLRLRAGREFFVPCDIAVGWNWGYPEFAKGTRIVVANPNGLVKYKGTDPRTRV